MRVTDVEWVLFSQNDNKRDNKPTIKFMASNEFETECFYIDEEDFSFLQTKGNQVLLAPRPNHLDYSTEYLRNSFSIKRHRNELHISNYGQPLDMNQFFEMFEVQIPSSIIVKTNKGEVELNSNDVLNVFLAIMEQHGITLDDLVSLGKARIHDINSEAELIQLYAMQNKLAFGNMRKDGIKANVMLAFRSDTKMLNEDIDIIETSMNSYVSRVLSDDKYELDIECTAKV